MISSNLLILTDQGLPPNTHQYSCVANEMMAMLPLINNHD